MVCCTPKEGLVQKIVHKRWNDVPPHFKVKLWFELFRWSRKSITDNPKCGRPVKADDRCLKISFISDTSNQKTLGMGQVSGR